jgi:alkylated DNA repair dioxygenase AlkB
MHRSGRQPKLIDVARTFPNGLVYRPEFLTPTEESLLLGIFRSLSFQNAPFREYTARRRIVAYGWLSGTDSEAKQAKLPHFLRPLSRKISKWLNIAEARVRQAVITEYQPGTPLGFHRDREATDHIVGISLGAWCQMRFRPLGSKDPADILALELEPRSAYIMQNESRSLWQHGVSPTKALRYSITFRTLPKNSP